MIVSSGVLFRLLAKVTFAMVVVALLLPSQHLAAQEPMVLFALQDLTDTDGDGLPNYLDADDDNDGVTDELDYAPLDPLVWEAPPPPPVPSPTPQPTVQAPAQPTETPVPTAVPPTAVPTVVTPPTAVPSAQVEVPAAEAPVPTVAPTAPDPAPAEVPPPASAPQSSAPLAPVVASLPETGSGANRSIDSAAFPVSLIAGAMVISSVFAWRRFGFRE